MKKTTYEIQDYISTNQELTNHLLTSNNNIYLHKSDTGMGGSSVFINQTSGKYILIQPLTGMIEGKVSNGNNDNNNNTHYIYSGSKDKLINAINSINTKGYGTICTTAEQIVYTDQLDKIKDYTLVVDESDAYTTTTYRAEAFYLLHKLIINKHFKRIIATTATPLYDYIDIPNGIIDEVIYVKRNQERNKYLSVTKTLPLANIIANVNNGDKVVIFTNQTNNYNLMLNNNDLSQHIIQCLTSDGIKPKINPKTFKVNEQFTFDYLNNNASIYILSTKYLIGYDIPFDAHIYIINDDLNGLNSCETKTHNEIIQAYGRVRKSVLSATLIQNGEPLHYNQDTIDSFYNKSDKSYKEYEEFMIEINKKNICDTFDNKIFGRIMANNGFKLKFIDENGDKIQKEKCDFGKKVQNLVIETNITLESHLSIILLNLEGDLDIDTAFRYDLALQYASAIAIKQLQLQSIINKDRVRVERVVEELYKHKDLILNTEAKKTIETAYFIYFFDENIKKDNKCELIKMYDIADKVLVKAINTLAMTAQTSDKRVRVPGYNNVTTYPKEIIIDGKPITINQFINLDHNPAFVNVMRDITTKLKKYDADKVITVLDKVTEILKELRKIKNFESGNILYLYNSMSLNIKAVRKRYNNYLKYLLVKTTSNNPINFKITKKDDREYNPVTKVPSALRSIVPQYHQMIDIKAANPTFIDYIIGSNLKDEVYNNIMKSDNIDRKEAKVLYNSNLNTIGKSFTYYKNFGIKCGYNDDQSIKLANILAKNNKGDMFRLMTSVEVKAIKLIIKDLSITNYTRLHDAIMIHDTLSYNISKEISDGYIRLNINKEF